MKLFRDPVYDYIACDENEIRIIDSPWFQRLRHCSQNGPAKLVFPTLFGSRFEHSLGVMHLAEKMLLAILTPSKYIKDNTLTKFISQARNDIEAFTGQKPPKEKTYVLLKRWIRLAGLCHDLGHFPLSHTLESVFGHLYWDSAFPEPSPHRACHEVISAEFVRQIAFPCDESDVFKSSDGKQIISKQDALAIILLLLLPDGVKIGDRPLKHTVFSTLHEIIVGTYDVDRLDYLQRDTHLVSGNFNLIDIERFFGSLRLVKHGELSDFVIMPTYKGMSAIETLLIERYKQKKWVHAHHKVAFYDRLVREVAEKTLIDSKNYLFKNYSLPMKVVVDKNYNELTTAERESFIGKYRTNICKQLARDVPENDLWPLSVFPPGVHFDRYMELDCKAFILNDDSRFIDDIWFSQECRNREDAEAPLWIRTLVERKATSVSMWKGPDLFRSFFNSVSKKLLAQMHGHPEDIDDKKFTATLRVLFGNEDGIYEEIFGKKQLDHCREIEKYLTHKLDFCDETLQVRISFIRWANLFFDKKRGAESKKVYVSKGRFCNIDKESALIDGLINLREEVLFYIYFVGDEERIRTFKNSLKGKRMYDSIKNNIAVAFSEAIIKDMKQNCDGNDEKTQFLNTFLGLN
ncbi:HD domain-containing protein [Candidatus Pacearchaeota archaeon]|nr:HD domain-containing protein [Candidatus Pacearchaeota archaeon]